MVKIVLICLGILALAVACIVYIVLVGDCLYWANTNEKGDIDRESSQR